MKIKEILDEIANEGGSNAKMDILRKYEDNDQLKRVLYLAHSPRIKFYIKQIPEYKPSTVPMALESALSSLGDFYNGIVTGNTAVNRLSAILSMLSQDDAEVIERIIDKSAKIGMGTSNINKVFKDLIEKTPYQGAKPFAEELAKKLFEQKHVQKYGVRSDIKMDGRYGNGIVRGGEAEMVSRQGEETHVGKAMFMREMSGFPDCVLNGELTIDGLDRYTANGIVASIVDIEGERGERGEVETQKKIDAFSNKHGNYLESLHNIRYTVWDMLTVDEYFDKKSSRPYHERRRELKNLLNEIKSTRISLVESKLVYSYGEAVKHFQEALNRGLEGTIIKDTNGAWKDGKPNWQIKMKLEINVDLKIAGFNYGSEGTKNEFVISSLDVESSDGLIKTSPAGMNEEMMQYVTDNQDMLLGTIVEVKCSGLSQNSKGEYSLLHPVFKNLRVGDKDYADSLGDVIKIEEAAKSLA